VALAFFEFLLLLQPAATPTAPGGGGGGASSSMPCGTQSLVMLAGLALVYFLFLRPDNKRRQEAEEALKSLKPGQKVRTSGGILGTIVTLTEREVVLAVADKVRINVLRENIRGPEVEPPPPEAAKADASKKEDPKKEDPKKDAPSKDDTDGRREGEKKKD
jgi:preprotein translocase subunit YajC